MRAEKLSIRGFRRFKRAELDLSEKVIALVGPNEAGKSSLLKALATCCNHTAIEPSDLTRGHAPDEQFVFRTRFRLEQSDLEFVRSLKTDSVPTSMTVYKDRSGGIQYEFEPEVLRRKGDRHAAAKALKALSETGSFAEIGPATFTIGQSDPKRYRVATSVEMLIKEMEKEAGALLPES